MKLIGTHCLRTEGYYGIDSADLAKDICSEESDCVGIFRERTKNHRNETEYTFDLCVASTYISTAWDKYQTPTNILLRKAPNVGNYVMLVAA